MQRMTGDRDGRTGLARSVYELHIIHPDTAERHIRQLQNLFADLLLGALGPGGNIFVKVTFEIVDIRTHATVLTMEQPVEMAQGMADLISKDLDRLDAAQFADEWGITPDASSPL
jgi:hypothetical protein